MYDFDNDGYITPEDIRLMLSYLPFKLSQNILVDDISEGMLSKDEGNNRNYNDRMSEQ